MEPLHPSKPRKKGRFRRGIYLLPSVFTVGTLLCGYFAILSTLRGIGLLAPGIAPGDALVPFDNAAKAIGWAILFDGLDGRIARLTNSASEFGREFDSLADVITFGVAPAVLAYAWGIRALDLPFGVATVKYLREIGWIVTFAYVICGAARLARFNIDSGKSTTDRRFFVGLPIPAAAGVVAAIVHWQKFPLDERGHGIAALGVLALLAFLMVSKIRYYSFKGVNLRQRRPYVVIIVLGLIVWSIAAFSEPVLLALALTYLISGLLGLNDLADQAAASRAQRGARRMKVTSPGYRVAVVGASSLLGQELLTVLKERRFPVAHLVEVETEAEEPELPVLDLLQVTETSESTADLHGIDFDFVFLAAAPATASAAADLVLRAAEGKGTIIDLIAAEAKLPDAPAARSAQILSIPSLERAGLAKAVTLTPVPAGRETFLAPHPGAIMLSNLVLRLAAQFTLRSATAHFFVPAVEMGSRAVEELQNQTVNLLSFQKPPQKIFGAQLAFNILPRLGRTRATPLTDLERRIRFQTQKYLMERAPLPALRLIQVPVFSGLSLSLFVEMAELVTLDAVASALEGDHLQVRKATQLAPSPVDAAGTEDILTDAIGRDGASSYGVWIWAAVDSLHLAAVNAVEIAESVQAARPPATRVQ